MLKISLGENLKLSRIIHGYWRLVDWKLSSIELLQLIQKTVDLGVTSFDHADIYGNYQCESLFGDALKLKPAFRQDIQIITKCGILLPSSRFPDLTIKHYDYSYNHIVSSAERSLENLGTDYIDLLLLHRPAPFLDPEEVAKAFRHLKSAGKVLNFGVANFNVTQYEMLNSYLDEPLVTNQVEISPACLDYFEEGGIDHALKERIHPMAWSPLAGGRVLNPQSQEEQRVYEVLVTVSEKLNVQNLDSIVYAWLLQHPVGIVPIVGTQKLERIQIAVEALNIHLSLEQWYAIYAASLGRDVP